MVDLEMLCEPVDLARQCDLVELARQCELGGCHHSMGPRWNPRTRALLWVQRRQDALEKSTLPRLEQMGWTLGQTVGYQDAEFGGPAPARPLCVKNLVVHSLQCDLVHFVVQCELENFARER